MTTLQSVAKSGINNPMYGRRSATWKGGRKIHNGYWLVWEPSHPLAQKNGYIAEHRLVMMIHLNRLLLPSEVVHHINGDKLDNRKENLKVMKLSDHISHHNLGIKRSMEFIKNLSKRMKHNNYGKKFIKGIIPWNKGMKGENKNV